MNFICLLGRLTADPELRHTQSRVPVTSFTLAVDRSFTPKGQEKQTDFINIVAWRQTAEFVTRYFHKGQKLALTGTLQSRKYTDKDGNNRTTFEVVADNVFFAESKQDWNSHPQPANQPQTAFSGQSGAYQPPQDFEEITDDGEPLPF